MVAADATAAAAAAAAVGSLTVAAPRTLAAVAPALSRAAAVGPARYCLPRHRMPFNSRNEGSLCV